MRRKVWLFAALGAFMLVGLSQSNLSGPLIYNSNQSDPKPRAFDTKVVDAFKKKYPGIQMEFNTVDHETFQDTSIRTYLASNNPPDVLTWFAGNRMRAFSSRDLAMDITDVWKSNNWEKVVPKGFQALSKDSSGKYVFLPVSYYWWAVYYRKDIFAKLGLKEPKTWDEFLAVSKKLKDAGYIPIANAAKETWPQGGWFDFLDMRVNGPEFHKDLTDGKIPYTDPRVKKVFTYWAQLVNNKYLLENPASYTWQDAANLMIQGKAAMYLMGDFIRDQYPADRAAAELDFFRFPIIDPKVPIGEEAPTDGYFIPAKAKNVANAKAFMSFLGSKEVAEMAAQDLGRLPVRNDVDVKTLFKDKPYVQKGIAILDQADLIMQFYDRDTVPEMARIGMDGFVRFLSQPNQVDSILADLETARKRIFSQ
ncbi:ABC transporter substrate-binding protein [Meiothermus granaticius]|uniref:Putative sugar-binding periplasmic protein n=1 Tax=Meiothermus granaticius NBRC 107808 TaxID=1227551 RepID=A0A399F7V8_9DEIN|nr:ABC transporter substrate-binding protein [Meiothermus granaticius]MCL6525425.1 ABC transporter substrate-binding protein [Thermaceae bacterium]RIH92757.1 putative sugar-binding periplasmic protein [Meiothermus granaticius NBRC 107808]GEM87336.1 ABC transporter substrate-binding protein [Meiothermus granaticius NBRC 107808]